MMRWSLVVLALLACSRPKPEGPPAPAAATPCPRVADHLVGLMSGATKYPPEATDPLRQVIEKRCSADRWSDGATQCLLGLTNLADGDRCQAQMTPAQVDAFQHDMQAAVVQLSGDLGAAGPAADAGSAPAD